MSSYQYLPLLSSSCVPRRPDSKTQSRTRLMTGTFPIGSRAFETTWVPWFRGYRLYCQFTRRHKIIFRRLRWLTDFSPYPTGITALKSWLLTGPTFFLAELSSCILFHAWWFRRKMIGINKRGTKVWWIVYTCSSRREFRKLDLTSTRYNCRVDIRTGHSMQPGRGSRTG